MSWRSETFPKPDRQPTKPEAEAISRAVDKYEDAMADLVRQARVLAEDRRKRLDTIRDPALRRSAAR